MTSTRHDVTLSAPPARSEVDVAIEVRDVTTGYSRPHAVLRDVSLQVKTGDFLALVGPNGGGKTTLLRAILGLLPLWQGQIRLFGEPPRRGRRHVGYVPQAIHFDNEFPIGVLDVVLMGRLGARRLLRWYGREDRRLAEWALDRVGLLDVSRHPIGNLSGGQRQRVYIARALAARPAALLLDEPTAQVDPESRAVVYRLLRELNEEVTVVMVSHDVDAVAEWCQSVACVDRRLYVPEAGLVRDAGCGHAHLPVHTHGHAADPSCAPASTSPVKVVP